MAHTFVGIFFMVTRTEIIYCNEVWKQVEELRSNDIKSNVSKGSSSLLNEFGCGHCNMPFMVSFLDLTPL